MSQMHSIEQAELGKLVKQFVEEPLPNNFNKILWFYGKNVAKLGDSTLGPRDYRLFGQKHTKYPR